jgi:hypothetical protein
MEVHSGSHGMCIETFAAWDAEKLHWQRSAIKAIVITYLFVCLDSLRSNCTCWYCKVGEMFFNGEIEGIIERESEERNDKRGLTSLGRLS